MITAVNLTKNFEGIQALDGVSFHIEKGEILGFLGPNGAGKTTTMRILTCYFPATSGSAKVADFDCMQNSMEVRRRVGYLPENFPVYPEMPVRSYLDFVAAVKGVPGSERKARIDSVLGDCGLDKVEERAVGKLSKGFKQRVGLAQAIISKPPVLILDEPTVGLDPVQIVEIRDLIKRQAQHSTIILSTHILQEVSALCTRVIIINKGRIIAEDTPDNLKTHLEKLTRIQIEVEGAPDKVKAVLKKLSGVEKFEQIGADTASSKPIEYHVFAKKPKDIRKELAQAIVGAELGLTVLRPMDLTLEEVYIQMVNAGQPVAAPIAKPAAAEVKPEDKAEPVVDAKVEETAEAAATETKS